MKKRKQIPKLDGFVFMYSSKQRVVQEKVKI